MPRIKHEWADRTRDIKERDIEFICILAGRTNTSRSVYIYTCIHIRVYIGLSIRQKPSSTGLLIVFPLLSAGIYLGLSLASQYVRRITVKGCSDGSDGHTSFLPRGRKLSIPDGDPDQSRDSSSIRRNINDSDLHG